MPVKLVHYVELFFPGPIATETSVKKVASRNPEEVEIPEECYCFRFFDKVEEEVIDRKLASAPENYSGHYFVGGELKTINEVIKEDPDSVLASRMKLNNITAVIKIKQGQHIPFEQGDIIILGNKVEV